MKFSGSRFPKDFDPHLQLIQTAQLDEKHQSLQIEVRPCGTNALHSKHDELQGG